MGEGLQLDSYSLCLFEKLFLGSRIRKIKYFWLWIFRSREPAIR